MGQYLEEIGRYQRLTRDEERDLGRKLRSTNPEDRDEARERLFLANLRLVVTVAKPFQRGRFELWDLVAAGNTGLWHAAGLYDERRGVPFGNYASNWIKQRILRAIPTLNTVPVPAYLAGDINKILRFSTKMQDDLGRSPTVEEIAHALQLPLKRVQDLMHLVSPILSVDAPVGDDGPDGGALGERLGETYDEADARLTSRIAARDRRKLLLEALERLPQREKEVLRLVFGFDTPHGDGVDPDFVAKRMGISRERVRQIKKKGLAALAKDSALRAGLEDIDDIRRA